MERWQTAGFGLYVHWPFCQSKCPYCDFNSHVANRVDHDGWRKAFRSEIERWSQKTSGRVLTSIFFGGGTPSLMSPLIVDAVIDAAAQTWTFANNVEITLEANPTSAEAGKFREFRTAGVNRVSIGVQALRDKDLRQLGRTHDVSEAMRAIDWAQSTFDRTSFDLIYARQNQTLSEWEQELNEAISICGDHLSLYQLTVEPGTVFGARFDRGLLQGLPSEDLSADMFELTQEICSDQGLFAYEVSNHCRQGEESRHNLIYWESGDYLGIGPGAHGRLTNENGKRWAIECPRAPEEWLARVFSGQGGNFAPEELSRLAQARECLVMGLRLAKGISLGDYLQISGLPLEPATVSELLELQLIECSGDTLRVTRQGRMMLNAVLRKLSP